jgi:hypothetical protein
LLARAYPEREKGGRGKKIPSIGFRLEEFSATRLSFARLIDYARDSRPLLSMTPFEHQA